MEPSTTNKIRRPLGDLTNTISQGNQDNHGSPQAFLDPIARKRHRDRERYASMSAEKKNERNRKARERRRENRQRNDQNPPIANQEGDTCVPVDQDENNEWLHRGSLHENNDPTHVAAHHPDGDDLLTSGQYTLADMGDSCIEGCASPVGHGGQPCSIEDQNVSPGERRRRLDRARRAAMSPEQRAILNKRRRDLRAAKRLLEMPQEKMTPEEKKDSNSQACKDYRKRAKEVRANNLHPDSIAMASPHFTPEVVFPHGEKLTLRVSEQMEVPEFNGTPVYIQPALEHPPTVESSQIVANRTIRRKPVTPGTRSSRLNRRNEQFEQTIGRNTQRPDGQTTQSCIIDNGGTETDAGENANPTPNVDTGTHTQPCVVDETQPKHDRQAETRDFAEEDDCDENVIFDDDEEDDEGYLFAGREGDEWDADEDIDLGTTNDDPNEADVVDPYGAVYSNVPNETHMLKPEDNCQHYNAKRFESEPPGFCCRSGDIYLYQDSSLNPEFPPELMRLWSSSDSDARHFREHIRHFNGHFSFTSLYCKLDSATTDTRSCGIYTFRAHGQIYHNVRSFGREDKHEPTHLELYFYDDDLSLDHRISKCREKTRQKDREVIQKLTDILHDVNPYSEHLRPMGQVENIADYHVELNMDQRLD